MFSARIWSARHAGDVERAEQFVAPQAGVIFAGGAAGAFGVPGITRSAVGHGHHHGIAQARQKSARADGFIVGMGRHNQDRTAG